MRVFLFLGRQIYRQSHKTMTLDLYSFTTVCIKIYEGTIRKLGSWVSEPEEVVETEMNVKTKVVSKVGGHDCFITP